MSTMRNNVPRLNLRALEEEVTGKSTGDKRVVINVGGQRHETWLSTLEKVPGTRLALLAHLQEADETYDITTGEYFFDRHPKVFDSVLHYHRTEELHMDKGACGNVMKGELIYWGIEENEIEPCCWADYSRYTEHKDTLKDLDDNFAYTMDDYWEGPDSSCKQAANKIWRFLEDPSSSRMAKLYAVTSMFFVALSIAIFVLESHPLFQIEKSSGRPMTEVLPPEDLTPTGFAEKCCCNSERNVTSYESEPHPALTILDYVCVAFFTLEVFVRFAFCPDKYKFIKSPLNIIDVICLLPHYASIALNATNTTQGLTSVVRVILILRIVRILRIFKLMKHYNAFKILVYTIKVSTKELLLMIVFLMSGVLMFASCIHYAEKENFPNIPIAIWWALVTMTTVGYGDKYPVDYLGYGIGCICVICGVLVIAFTVPIVVNNFSLYYSHAQTRIKIPKRRRKRIKELLQAGKDKLRSRSKSRQVKQTLTKADVALTSRNTNFSTIPTVTARTDTSRIRSTSLDRARIPSDRTYQTTGHGPLTAQVNQGHVAPAGQGVISRGVKGQPSVKGHSTGPTTVSPVEISDIESCDSGYTEPKNKKIKEESQKILGEMAESDRKMNDERLRQEKAVQKKKEQRAKKKTKQETAKKDSKTPEADPKS